MAENVAPTQSQLRNPLINNSKKETFLETGATHICDMDLYIRFITNFVNVLNVKYVIDLGKMLRVHKYALSTQPYSYCVNPLKSLQF